MIIEMWYFCIQSTYKLLICLCLERFSSKDFNSFTLKVMHPGSKLMNGNTYLCLWTKAKGLGITRVVLVGFSFQKLMQPISLCIFIIFSIFFFFLSFYCFLSPFYLSFYYMSTYLGLPIYVYLPTSTHLPISNILTFDNLPTYTNLSQPTNIPTFLYQHTYLPMSSYQPMSTYQHLPTDLYQSLNINL